MRPIANYYTFIIISLYWVPLTWVILLSLHLQLQHRQRCQTGHTSKQFKMMQMRKNENERTKRHLPFAWTDLLEQTCLSDKKRRKRMNVRTRMQTELHGFLYTGAEDAPMLQSLRDNFHFVHVGRLMTVALSQCVIANDD